MLIRLTPLRLLVLGVLALAAGIFFLVNWLVVTDAERVEMTVGELARAVEKNDVEAVMPFLDNTFRLDGQDTGQFYEWYGLLLKVLRVRRASVYETTVEIDRRQPSVAVATVLSFIETNRIAGEQRIDWRLEFQRRGEREWKLRGVRAYQPINGREIPITGAARTLIP